MADAEARKHVEGAEANHVALTQFGRSAVLRNGVPTLYVSGNVPLKEAHDLAEEVAGLLNLPDATIYQLLKENA